MFSLRKRAKAPPRAPQTGIRETVAGITGQIDHLVAITRDASSPTSDRVAACETVRSFVEFQSLSSVAEIWYAIRDVTDLDNPPEVRRAGWRLAQSCIDHDEVNNSAFTAYYSSIIRNSNVEDFDLVLTCLEHLTNYGRKIVGSQAPRHLPRVLLEWIQVLAVRSQEIRSNTMAQDITAQWGFSTDEAFNRVLSYTTNVLKFNMSVWDPIEIEKLLLIAVNIVRSTSQITDCQLCCKLIDSVIAFGLMPATVLQPVLEILCGIITMIPSLKPECVSIIQKLSRSHLQNSTIVRLCRILDSPNSEVTQSMRIAAAHQLKDLLMLNGSVYLDRKESPAGALKPITPYTMGPPASSQTIPPLGTALENRNGAHPGGVLDDASLSKDDPSLVDVSLPVLDVLESFYKTLLDPQTSFRLVLAILECFYDLVTQFNLLKRIHTTSWMWPNEDSDESIKVSPTNIVQQLSNLYADKVGENVTTVGDKDDDKEIMAFREKMKALGTALTDMLLEKSLASSLSSQILICLHISHFLDIETCNKLVDVIETLQFCTPGISNWFSNLKEVVDKLYLNRNDEIRAHVLKIVQDVYIFDAENEGWISVEDLEWVTDVTFDIVGSVDEKTLAELVELYDTHVFYSDVGVFEHATKRLVNAVISAKSNSETVRANSLKLEEALTVAFGKAYRLFAEKTLIVLKGLVQICDESVDQPEIFSKAWAILCRIRVDRWDRLLIVNHRVEDSYSEDLRKMQEPLPPQLEAVHAVPSLVLKVKDVRSNGSEHGQENATFDTLPILKVMLKVIQSENTQERTLVVTMLNAASQLAHYRVLCESNMEEKLPLLRELREELEAIIASGGAKISQTTMPSSSRRSAILCIAIHALSVLLPFEPLFPKTELDRFIHTLVTALGRWNLSIGWVVHCFTLACYEAPSSVQRYLPQILSRLQLKITGRDSSMYILDFLLSLSLEGSLTKNFTEQDFKRVFGMCFSFIQNANDQLALRYQSDIAAQWLLRLAYAAISNLFLSMRLENRRSLVPYLVRSLVLATRDPSWVDPMSLVVYDMINRFTYSDVPLRAHMDTIPKQDPGWEVRRWLRGVALLEIRCNKRTGEAVRIVRRPAGIFTTFMTPAIVSSFGSGFDPLDADFEEGGGGNYTANFYLLCGQLGLGTFQFPKDSIGARRNTDKAGAGSQQKSISSPGPSNASNGIGSTMTSASTIMNSGQTVSSASISIDSSTASTSDGDSHALKVEEQGSSRDLAFDEKQEMPAGTITPLALPDDAATNRAVSSLDRVPIVDLYKVGIIYCAPGQKTEAEILANSSGSAEYRKFLDKIGVLIRLKHNRMYYVGGLDTEQDLDGRYALAWSSKISQIIFHTITMMPNYDGDTQFASKKRHIGNNFVNIYFDESGEDFEFDIVKSQFNFINVVITPTYSVLDESRRYWKVRAYRKPGMKNTSAAYDVKVVSEDNLALFVRNLALKSSQYAAIHNLGAEYMDNWVYRLQLISTLRDRVEQANIASRQNKADDENGDANDDDYLISEDNSDPPTSNEEDIRLLNWMEFTRFTS